MTTEAKTPFIPGEMDDYPWTPDEFRLLARIARRVDQGPENGGLVGKCWESIPSIAASTGMAEKVARHVLNVLEAAGAIIRTRQVGDTTIIRYSGILNWVSADQLPDIRERLGGSRKERGSKSTRGKTATSTPVNSAMGVVADLPDKGTPSKVPPPKVPPPKLPQRSSGAPAKKSKTMDTKSYLESIGAKPA